MEAMTFDGFLTESTIGGEGRKAESIRNVLLCGLQSLNGRTIPASAFGGAERAKALYDACHCYLNHDVERGPSRRTEDLCGLVTNVRLDSLGRPRGDVLLSDNAAGNELRSLIKFAKRAAEVGASLKNVGMSHVARYTFSAYDRTRVESVDEVFSVDVVIRPATTQGFHESHTVPEKTASEFLASLGVADLQTLGTGPLEYAFNERALFDRNYDRDTDAGFYATAALSMFSGHTVDGGKALESVSFV